MTLSVGDRVYIEFLKSYGHIQRIQQREPIAALKETEPKTVYRVKRQGRDTLAAGFREQALKRVDRLTDLEIFNILKVIKYDTKYESETHSFHVKSLCWGVGEMAGEVFCEYDLMNKAQLRDEWVYSGISYCARECFRPDYDIPCDENQNEVLKYSYCTHKKSNQNYGLENICYGLDTMKGKKIVIYSKGIVLGENKIGTINFCREFEDFKLKFYWGENV